LRQLVNTFFDGSSTAAAAALLDLSDTPMDQTELKRLAALVAQAKKEGR
jgi:hypothetical protein